MTCWYGTKKKFHITFFNHTFALINHLRTVTYQMINVKQLHQIRFTKTNFSADFHSHAEADNTIQPLAIYGHTGNCVLAIFFFSPLPTNWRQICVISRSRNATQSFRPQQEPPCSQLCATKSWTAFFNFLFYFTCYLCFSCSCFSFSSFPSPDCWWRVAWRHSRVQLLQADQQHSGHMSCYFVVQKCSPSEHEPRI